MELSSIDLERKTLELANTLQSSLEIEKILDLFGAGLMPLVAHTGLEFLSDGIGMIRGEGGTHTCDYELTLGTTSIGRVILRRDHPFTDAEMAVLEALLCALTYPLRNAMLYKRALETALTDPMTGISNRAAMNATLQREVELAHRHGIPLSFVMVDVDHFKQINDVHGHLFGDDVLCEVARCIAECIRRSDILFRYGGEEFVALLSSTDIGGAMLLAQRIRGAVEHRSFGVGGQRVPVTVSVGVSALDEDDEPFDLIDKADRALYRAKDLGRNRVVEFAA
ncbi:MAG: GGDEF domain-containing protein [Gammaproteobacteria bacterium]|nr:GGDEF domain-containing protein [Gammaproteobacteria bacterium]